MSVTIQDDMWRSAGAMQGKQGDEFLLALIRYGFTGEEPSPKSRVYPLFVLCKERIDMSADASIKGRRMAKARWVKQNAQAPSKHDAQEQPEQDAEVRRGEESRGEVRREEESTNASERNAQVAEVVTHLNEKCGTSYRSTSKTSREYIGARLAEGFTVEDCERVIDNMAEAWGNDPKMRQYLRPTTLFRPEKFESYLNRRAEVGRYAEYD